MYFHCSKSTGKRRLYILCMHLLSFSTDTIVSISGRAVPLTITPTSDQGTHTLPVERTQIRSRSGEKRSLSATELSAFKEHILCARIQSKQKTCPNNSVPSNSVLQTFPRPASDLPSVPADTAFNSSSPVTQEVSVLPTPSQRQRPRFVPAPCSRVRPAGNKCRTPLCATSAETVWTALTKRSVSTNRLTSRLTRNVTIVRYCFVFTKERRW